METDPRRTANVDVEGSEIPSPALSWFQQLPVNDPRVPIDVSRGSTGIKCYYELPAGSLALQPIVLLQYRRCGIEPIGHGSPLAAGEKLAR